MSAVAVTAAEPLEAAHPPFSPDRAVAAAALGVEPAELDDGRSLCDYGLDSLMACHGLCSGRLGRGLARGRRTSVTVNLVAGVTFAVLGAFLLEDALTAAMA
ncbi:acyl carrier protein [Streptomyces sp. NPDC001544]|uniref:acyl carrier protein n=1 Tax=Streptomyces sp. NPDC001544 TaxID=3364584 RepID=UPI0036B8F4E3